MTVLLGFAAANVALIAADTRLNATFRDGRTGAHDEGPLELTYPDGRRTKVGTYFRKIRPSGRNWAGGAGFFTLAETALAALAPETSWDRARVVLDALGPEAIERTLRDFPGPSRSAISRTTILYVHFRSDRSVLDGYRFDGIAPFQGGAQYALITPPELPVSVTAEANTRLQNELRAPSSLDDLYSVIQTIAGVFRDVQQQSHSVSDSIEVGVTISSERVLRLRLLASNTAIVQAPPRDIARLMVAL